MENPVILYDDSCPFCCGWMHFVKKSSGGTIFEFAPLQSERGRSLLERHQLPLEDFGTMVFFNDNNYYLKSDAALQVIRRLPGIWKTTVILKFVPRFLRNACYDWVARNRHCLAGQKSFCRLK